MCTLLLVNCLGGLGISVATLTDRPDITMDVFSYKAHCWKTSCQCWCTCKSENKVVSTTTVLRLCFSGSVLNG